jgi:hypothetical protein
MEFNLTDLSGKEIFIGKEEMNVGTMDKTIDLSRFASGVYLLNIRKGEAVVNRKLIIR